MELEDLVKKVDANTERIDRNIKSIETNFKKIQENSGAIEVLHTIKSYNNRFFIMWIITFVVLVGSLAYNIYLLSDIGTIETTQEVEQSNESGSNNYIGRDGDINGYSKD